MNLVVFERVKTVKCDGELCVCVCVSEHILSALRSPKRRRTLNKLNGQLMADLLPLGCTLQTLAALQVDSNHKVSKAACKCLCRAAGVHSFKNKVDLRAF